MHLYFLQGVRLCTHTGLPRELRQDPKETFTIIAYFICDFHALPTLLLLPLCYLFPRCIYSNDSVVALAIASVFAGAFEKFGCGVLGGRSGHIAWVGWLGE